MTQIRDVNSIVEKRTAAVKNTVEHTRIIAETAGINPGSLKQIREALYQLASQKSLFPKNSFPAPTNGDSSRRYLLSEDPGNSYALYMNLVMPGHYSRPHNHTTWAAVVSVEGEEVNQFFRRTDDGSVPGKAIIEYEYEVIVKPGIGVALMPEDIHSIENQGKTPTMHLHMYGKALETLTERIAFDIKKDTYEQFKAPNTTIQM